MEVLRAENLVKTYTDGMRETKVLRNLNLTIEAGDFVSITGKSGTGKSTLIYQLGLLDEPTSGEIFVAGVPASSMSVKERTEYRLRCFGFVFQDYALIPELKAWENVALQSMMRGIAKNEAKAEAEKTLQRLGMGERVHHVPSELSGGESQRVSIARAISHTPSVLFADEPTANLDSERSRQILDIFHSLHEQGQTIIMVTHELEYAREAKRFIVVCDGQIETDKRL